MNKKMIAVIGIMLFGCSTDDNSIDISESNNVQNSSKAAAIVNTVVQDPNVLANSRRVMVNAQNNKSFQVISLKFDGTGGSPVFLRPAALGKFLLFTNNQYVTNVNHRLKLHPEPVMASIWQMISVPNTDRFVLVQDSISD